MGDAPVTHRSFIDNFLERMSGGDIYQRWTREGAHFGNFSARKFGESGLGPEDSVIGYTAANLEQLTLAKRRGAKALHVQVDPGISWYETRRQEQLAHPEAEHLMPMPGAEFLERMVGEWREADKVIVHSKHSRAALLAQGVDAGRCVVVPPAFSYTNTQTARRLDSSRPFRVLFVGNHCLTKGYHVFVDAARQAGEGFEFFSVGKQTMKSKYINKASTHVKILGSKSQTGVQEQMKRADVLVFPTLSDGFGLVQLEAMAAGLPVIATPCCGEVVKNRVNGLIVPPRESQAIVSALHQLRADAEKYEQLSLAASLRSLDYSPALHFDALLKL
jgi:glycosyltransferase involved in cell wall biosynthesis